MKLYVVRHGQTDINVRNLINSHNDDDLNEKGINQAKELREIINKTDYDFIICSPLTRTRHTADIINVKEKNIIVDDRLIERYAGEFTKASLDYIDDFDWWSLNPKRDYKDAETVLEIINRIKLFLDDIKEKYPNNNILIVTHGGVMKAIETYFKGIPNDNSLESYQSSNCELKTFEL